LINPRGEKFVTRMLMGGCGVTLVGGFLFALMLVQGLGQFANTKEAGGMAIAGFFLVIALGGIVMMVAGLFSGLKYSFGSEVQTDRQLPDVVVASRFAINSVGEMIFSNFEYDAPGGKLFVQLRFPDGHIEEMSTSWGVFNQCGEGMRGVALVKGSWLSSFAPIVKQSEPLHDPGI